MPLTRGFLCFRRSGRPGRTKLMKPLDQGKLTFPQVRGHRRSAGLVYIVDQAPDQGKLTFPQVSGSGKRFP